MPLKKVTKKSGKVKPAKVSGLEREPNNGIQFPVPVNKKSPSRRIPAALDASLAKKTQMNKTNLLGVPIKGDKKQKAELSFAGNN